MGAGAGAAGEGVAGTAGAEGAADGAGADGAAGVEAAALEGVEGACEGVAADEGALGCIRWYGQMQCSESFNGEAGVITFDTMHTMKPFSSMLYVSMVLSSWRIFPASYSAKRQRDKLRKSRSKGHKKQQLTVPFQRIPEK